MPLNRVPTKQAAPASTVPRAPRTVAPIESIEWMLARIMALYGRQRHDETTPWYREYLKVKEFVEKAKKQ